ncbi:MAG: hypothetical protein V7752_08115 [Halopseudomonas sp.]
MKALTSSYRSNKYLQITRSNSINLEDIKESRRRIVPLFEATNIERLLSDYREVNFDSVRAVDIYVQLKDFKEDFPQCKWVALVHRSAPQNLLQHYKNASSYYGMELTVHTELEAAKDWLCYE